MASGRSGIVLRQIRRLFDEGTLSGLTDAQLLERFVAGRDEGAFAILVERHGPMVLAVCRGVLKDINGAEDAFQATFLVLFRKAGGLRVGGSLGSWLYRVAYRIAIRANAVAARRRERSWEEGAMADRAAPPGTAEIDRELLPMIHQEIDRLPDRYRAPIALCCLEGLSYEDAARQLGWPLGTVGSRLARAKDLLRSRLARRGITATSVALAALLSREVTAAPAGWVEATTRTALGLDAAANGAKAAGAVSAAVALSNQVLRRMLVIKLIQMTALLTAVATAGFLAWTAAGPSKRPGALAVVAAQARTPSADAPKPKDDQDRSGKVPIRGRVIAPDGKPVRDASIYLGLSGSGWRIIPVAHTDAEGRFRFDLDTEAERREYLSRSGWSLKNAALTAEAPGYGAGWARAWNPVAGDVELRLVPDDVPIRGRILDTQGRPIPAVNVHVGTIEDPPAGDLDALLQNGTIRPDQSSRRFSNGAWWTKEGSEWVKRRIKTDPDGRFRVDGVGRDRLVLLELDGPGIENGRVWTMTRVAPPSARPQSVPTRRSYQPRIYPLHGATFDHVAGPSKPIEGVVRVKGTGRPVAGAWVSGHALANNAHVNVATDQDGRFRIDGLPKVASYRIQVDPKPGEPYLSVSTQVSDTDGLNPISVTFDLPKGVVVRVRLIDKANGQVGPGHTLTYTKLPSNTNEGRPFSRSQQYGPEGFKLTVPPGPAIFYAVAEGYDLPYIRARLASADRGKGVAGAGDDDGPGGLIILSDCQAYRIVDVPANVETFNLDLDLTRGAKRKGRVIDPDGKPVTDAVAYGLFANWQIKALDDATFEAIGLEPGRTRTVTFFHKGRRLAGAVLIGPGVGPVEVRLEPCGAAVGRLLDGYGEPLAGATIRLAPQDHRGQSFPGNLGIWPDGEIFTADQDGRFRVEGINPALGVRVGVHPRSRPDVSLKPEKAKEAILKHLTSRPGETVDLGEIHLSQ